MELSSPRETKYETRGHYLCQTGDIQPVEPFRLGRILNVGKYRPIMRQEARETPIHQAMNQPLTIQLLCQEAGRFAARESAHTEPALFGVTDGKAIGTYFEHKFRDYLQERYRYEEGSSASGIDFPGLGVDMKVTRVTQPQSSCPFRSARQKIYGLGYSLLVFVYEKIDDQATQTGRLNILHSVFVDANRTADYQTTTGLRRIIENAGNEDDLIAFMQERSLPVDDIQALQLAQELLQNPPETGYLTISNALQWRLQYRRVIDEAGGVAGIRRIR